MCLILFLEFFLLLIQGILLEVEAWTIYCTDCVLTLFSRRKAANYYFFYNFWAARSAFSTLLLRFPILYFVKGVLDSNPERSRRIQATNLRSTHLSTFPHLKTYANTILQGLIKCPKYNNFKVLSIVGAQLF
jgi:hypothetical protein